MVVHASGTDDHSTGGGVAEALAKGSRITGEQRQELASRLAARYRDGESIRAIADDTGRSFGFVHGLIKESGIALRTRGGATRGAAAVARRTGSTAAPTADQPAPAATEDGGSKVKKARAAAPKPDKKARAKKPDKDDSKKSKKGKRR